MGDWYQELQPETPQAPPPQSGGTDWYNALQPERPPIRTEADLAKMIQYGTEGAADIGDVAVASLAEDPKAQIRYYAKEMGIPENRFGVVQGEIVYLRDDGKLQAVAPGTLRKTARGAGPALPAIGGALGSIGGMAVTAPTGPGALGGAAIGGMTGAAGGQAVREYAANKLMGQDFSPERVAREAVIDAGATLTGLLVGKGYSRAMATRAGKELSRLMKTEGRQAMDALRRTLGYINKEYGVNIRLTPAELSNVAELRGQQLALENTPRTNVPLEDFYVARGEQTGQAMDKYLGRLSPVSDPDIAGEGLSQASGKALKAIKAERVAKGSPAYQAAFRASGPVDTTPVINAIEDELATGPKGLKGPLEAVRADLFDEVYDPATKQMRHVAVTDIETLQNRVKETLDDEIQAAYRTGRAKVASRLQNVQKELLRTMDEASPNFKAARDLWGDLSGPVTQAEGGILPLLEKTTAKDWEYLGTKFFGRSSPSEIARARARILAVDGGEDAWNAALRGFLEQRWEQAGRIYKSKISRPALAQGAQPAAFWAEMLGDPSQKMRLQSAMSPREYAAFKTLMDVFEATGRAASYNSTTAAQQAGRELLNQQATGLSAVRTVTNPFGTLKRAEDAIAEWSRNANLDDIVRVITNGDSVEELLKVQSRSTPRDKKWLAVAKALNLVRTQAMAGPGETFMPPPALGEPIGP